MTENDKEILRQSETLTSIDWETAYALSKKQTLKKYKMN